MCILAAHGSIVKRQTEGAADFTTLTLDELCKNRHPDEYFRLTPDGDCRDVVRYALNTHLCLFSLLGIVLKILLTNKSFLTIVLRISCTKTGCGKPNFQSDTEKKHLWRLKSTSASFQRCPFHPFNQLNTFEFLSQFPFNFLLTL